MWPAPLRGAVPLRTPLEANLKQPAGDNRHRADDGRRVQILKFYGRKVGIAVERFGPHSLPNGSILPRILVIRPQKYDRRVWQYKPRSPSLRRAAGWNSGNRRSPTSHHTDLAPSCFI